MRLALSDGRTKRVFRTRARRPLLKVPCARLPAALEREREREKERERRNVNPVIRDRAALSFGIPSTYAIIGVILVNYICNHCLEGEGVTGKMLLI